MASLFDFVYDWFSILCCPLSPTGHDACSKLLQHNCSRGVNLRLIYVGMGTDLLSGLSVEHALHTFGILPHSKTLIRCVEATDHDPRCQRLLLAFGDRIEHVYGDLMDG